jgi:hypothetical protein
MDETYQHIVIANVNLLSRNINTIKNTEGLLSATQEVGLEVNTEKSKYILMSDHQAAGQNCNIQVANTCFENVAKLKYLATMVTNQNCIHEEIKN